MRNKPSCLILICCLLLLVVMTAPVSSEESGRGILKTVRDGKVERFQQGGWHRLLQGAPVSLGDRLRTDSRAVAIIELPSHGKLVLGPSSEIELGKDPVNLDTRLARGGLWMNAKLPKGTTATISTSLATAGVRSTSFAVYNSGTSTDVCTCEGLVSVAVTDGSVFNVHEGKQVLVSANSAQLSSGYKAIDSSRLPIVSKFCQTCHIKGGGAALKPGWK